jgi:hypothetical protein
MSMVIQAMAVATVIGVSSSQVLGLSFSFCSSLPLSIDRLDNVMIARQKQCDVIDKGSDSKFLIKYPYSHENMRQSNKQRLDVQNKKMHGQGTSLSD